MLEIKRKEECAGCHGCANVCPTKCIEMKYDKEGFMYPDIDLERCINCHLCEKVCPVLETPQREDFKPVAYASKNNDDKVRLESSSGGIFTLLSKKVIENNGVVFGAAFDEKFVVRHTYADTLDGIEKFRGSKYVQSEIGNTYALAKEFLNQGREVFFTGTQCQIKGLNLFLRKKYDNLLTGEVICHGVPSPKIFKYYIDKLSEAEKSKIKSIKFRSKEKGWKNFSFVTEFENNKVYSKTLNEDSYMQGFLKDIYLRPSCYECKAKNFSSAADLALADYWGVTGIHPSIDDDKGISLIVVNSKKGEESYNAILGEVTNIKTSLEYGVTFNKCIVKSVDKNPNRDLFFEKLSKDNVKEVIDETVKLQNKQRNTKKHQYIRKFEQLKKKVTRKIIKIRYSIENK